MKVQLVVEFEARDEADASRIEAAVRTLASSLPDIAVTVRRNEKVL